MLEGGPAPLSIQRLRFFLRGRGAPWLRTAGVGRVATPGAGAGRGASVSSLSSAAAGAGVLGAAPAVDGTRIEPPPAVAPARAGPPLPARAAMRDRSAAYRGSCSFQSARIGEAVKIDE